MKIKLLSVLALAATMLGACAPTGDDTEYKVTFANYDETVLFTDTVKAGETAVYEGETPTRPADDEYTYTFSGWDKTLTNVQSSFTTKATYTSTPIGGGEVVPTSGYHILKDGQYTEMTLNEGNEDPSVEAEYMALNITFAVGDTFTIFDATNSVNLVIDDYRDDTSDPTDATSAFVVGDLTRDGDTITVTYAGAYSMYLKFYVENDWIELWIGAISGGGVTPPPVEEGNYYIVGEGSFLTGDEPWSTSSGILLTKNEGFSGDGVEYMGIGIEFAVGDKWKVCSDTGIWSTYFNQEGNPTWTEGLMSLDEGGNALVEVEGLYDVYAAFYNDGGNSVWVVAHTGA